MDERIYKIDEHEPRNETFPDENLASGPSTPRANVLEAIDEKLDLLLAAQGIDYEKENAK